MEENTQFLKPYAFFVLMVNVMEAVQKFSIADCHCQSPSQCAYSLATLCDLKSTVNATAESGEIKVALSAC